MRAIAVAWLSMASIRLSAWQMSSMRNFESSTTFASLSPSFSFWSGQVWHGCSSRSAPASCAGGETYIIEYLGDKTLPGESIAVNPDGAQPGSAVHAYLITAEGETGQGATRRIQAPYTTYERP